MADVVLDENGYEIDEDGNKKVTLCAWTMDSKDVMAVLANFTKDFNDVVQSIQYVQYGLELTRGQDDLARLAGLVLGGSHVTFARENSDLSDLQERNKFLTRTNPNQSIPDRKMILELYNMVVKTAQFRQRFASYINFCSNSHFERAYLTIRFESQLSNEITKEDINQINKAFIEFDQVYKTYNNAHIYEVIPVNSTENTFEENLEMVLDHMDDALCKTANLSEFLMNTRRNAATGINRLFVYDKQTKHFDDYACREDTFKRALDECCELSTELGAFYTMFTGEMTAYLDCFRHVLDAIEKVFERVLHVLDDFKTREHEAPYAIMHYDEVVKNVVNKYVLSSLGDPIKDGTRYCSLANIMLERFRSLARTVAKQAPK